MTLACYFPRAAYFWISKSVSCFFFCDNLRERSNDVKVFMIHLREHTKKVSLKFNTQIYRLQLSIVLTFSYTRKKTSDLCALPVLHPASHSADCPNTSRFIVTLNLIAFSWCLRSLNCKWILVPNVQHEWFIYFLHECAIFFLTFNLESKISL